MTPFDAARRQAGPARITTTHLLTLNACAEQIDLFARTFPRGTAVTLSAARKAVDAGIDLRWLAGHLPAPAREAYKKAITPAREAYSEAITPAFVAAWRIARKDADRV